MIHLLSEYPISKEINQTKYDTTDKYAYRNQFGHYIICWDSGKYVNHSFNSNCVSTAYDFELAVRDIEPGEELTDDYGYLNVTHPFDCLPEHGSQRTRVYPDDLLNYYYIWDAKLIDAFQSFLSVDQPLNWFITNRNSMVPKALMASTDFSIFGLMMSRSSLVHSPST